MATPLTDNINALTTYANEVTGASDTNLSDAVHTLASGYGQGGGVSLAYYIKSDETIITEDRITTATRGNLGAFKQDFLPDMQTPPYPTVLVIIDNTYTDAAYTAQTAIRLSAVKSSSSATVRKFVRTGGECQDQNGNSFFIGAGSTLYRHFFVRENQGDA